MGNKHDFLVAADARNIASEATRLINRIAKNIKDEAEEGRCTYIYRADFLTDEAIERVKVEFTELGYEVNIMHDTCAREIDDDNKLDPRAVFFIFKW